MTLIYCKELSEPINVERKVGYPTIIALIIILI